MRYEDGDTGYRSKQFPDGTVEVSVHRGGEPWVFSVEAAGTHILQGELNDASIAMLKGAGGDIHTSASVYDLIKDAASDYDELEGSF